MGENIRMLRGRRSHRWAAYAPSALVRAKTAGRLTGQYTGYDTTSSENAYAAAGIRRLRQMLFGDCRRRHLRDCVANNLPGAPTADSSIAALRQGRSATPRALRLYSTIRVMVGWAPEQDLGVRIDVGS
jgi:hypothetical protein